MSEKEKRARSANFSSQEKLLLITLAAKYKHILENKKTDTVSNQEKEQVWGAITTEFNSQYPDNNYRNKESLKRLYENKKKDLRRKAANEQFETKKTGGGIPIITDKKEPCDEILLSIVNKKTIFGLPTQFGGDADSETEEVVPEEVNSQNSNPLVTFGSNDCHVEYIYSDDDGNENNINMIPKCSAENSWKKPVQLKQAIDPALKMKASSIGAIENGNDIEVVVEDTKKTIPSSSNANETPKGKRQLPLNRRRPAVAVKALTTSEISEKYNSYLDKRMELVTCRRNDMETRAFQNKIEHTKRVQLLDLQIEIEKENLKRLRRDGNRMKNAFNEDTD